VGQFGMSEHIMMFH